MKRNLRVLCSFICIVISCGPDSSEVVDRNPDFVIKQTEQGVCIFHRNGAVACPSALQIIGSNPRIKIKMVDK